MNTGCGAVPSFHQTWPVTPHLIGWTSTDHPKEDGYVTIYGAETHNGAWAVGPHALVDVPTNVALEVGKVDRRVLRSLP